MDKLAGSPGQVRRYYAHLRAGAQNACVFTCSSCYFCFFRRRRQSVRVLRCFGVIWVHTGHFVCIFTCNWHPLAKVYFPTCFRVFIFKGSFWGPAGSQLDAIIGISCKARRKCIAFYLLSAMARAGDTSFYVAWPTWVAESMRFLRALFETIFFCAQVRYICSRADLG